MRGSEIARRYGRAMFELAKESGAEEATLQSLREVSRAVGSSEELRSFFNTPLVSAAERKSALSGLFEKVDVEEIVRSLLFRLVEKGRFTLLPSIAEEFQAEVDQNNGVVRGQVRSAAALWPEERAKLEQKISNYTGKKAVLEYQEDKALLGGMVAHVGSLTFDDSLETQLRLVKDELKRRAN